MVETGPVPINSTASTPDGPQKSWSFSDVPEYMNVANASAYSVDIGSRFVLAWTFLQIVNGSVGIEGRAQEPLFSGVGSQSAIVHAM